MTREEKNLAIDELTGILNDNSTIYVADIAGLNAGQTSQLRRLCFQKGVKLSVVKNTLLKKAMERSERNFDDLFVALKGNTSIMLSDTGNVPAKLIKDYRKKGTLPLLKGAYIDEAIFIGDNQLETLSTIKGKTELLGDIITLLQSPARNVISALQSGGNTISGLLTTLENRDN
jgi:large subunit ribosomal protein L10